MSDTSAKTVVLDRHFDNGEEGSLANALGMAAHRAAGQPGRFDPLQYPSVRLKDRQIEVLCTQITAYSVEHPMPEDDYRPLETIIDVIQVYRPSEVIVSVTENITSVRATCEPLPAAPQAGTDHDIVGYNHVIGLCAEQLDAHNWARQAQASA